MKPVGPFLKHFGSKWQSAKRYPDPLPGSTIFEPFAGGAGYSCRYSDHKVVLWENNPRLQELWCWLIYTATSQDILDIPLGVPEGTDIRTLGLSWGQASLLKHWQRTNNVGPCMTISPWGNLPGQFTASCRARLADELGAIKHWQFAMPDWTKPGTWFVDGPYQYNYRYGQKSFDFQSMANNVMNISAGSMAIVCEAACPKTQAVPDYLPFVPSHRQVTSRRKATQSHHSRELVYVKYT